VSVVGTLGTYVVSRTRYSEKVGRIAWYLFNASLLYIGAKTARGG
jgi:hypothetical protein